MNDRQHTIETIDVVAFCAATGSLFLGMYTPRAAWLQCDQSERPPGRHGDSTVNNCAMLECPMYAIAQSPAPGAPCMIFGMAMYGSEQRPGQATPEQERENRLEMGRLIRQRQAILDARPRLVDCWQVTTIVLESPTDEPLVEQVAREEATRLIEEHSGPLYGWEYDGAQHLGPRRVAIHYRRTDPFNTMTGGIYVHVTERHDNSAR